MDGSKLDTHISWRHKHNTRTLWPRRLQAWATRGQWWQLNMLQIYAAYSYKQHLRAVIIHLPSNTPRGTATCVNTASCAHKHTKRACTLQPRQRCLGVCSCGCDDCCTKAGAVSHRCELQQRQQLPAP